MLWGQQNQINVYATSCCCINNGLTLFQRSSFCWICFYALLPEKIFMLFVVFAKSTFSKKNISGILSVCIADWIQIRPDVLSGLIWVQSVCEYEQTTPVGNEITGTYVSVCKLRNSLFLSGYKVSLYWRKFLNDRFHHSAWNRGNRHQPAKHHYVHLHIQTEIQKTTLILKVLAKIHLKCRLLKSSAEYIC